YSEVSEQPYSEVSEQPYSEVSEQPYSEVSEQPYSHEYEQEQTAEQDTRMVNQAYEKFVNAVAMNPSSFHQQMEQFVPVALQAVRVAFKVIPPLRRSVVKLIAQLLEKLLG